MIQQLFEVARINEQRYQTNRGALGNQQAKIKELEKKEKSNRETIEGLATWVTALATRIEDLEKDNETTIVLENHQR